MNTQETARRMKASGMSNKAIAETLKLTPGRISQILSEPPADSDDLDPLKRKRIELLQVQIERQRLALDRERRTVLPTAEVQDMFLRVFQSYRQSIAVITRKYGKEAGEILAAAERSAIQTARKEKELEETAAAMREESSKADA